MDDVVKTKQLQPSKKCGSGSDNRRHGFGSRRHRQSFPVEEPTTTDHQN